MNAETPHSQSAFQASDVIMRVRQQAAVAQCWTTQLLLLLGVLVLGFLQAAIKDDFSIFLHDPGDAGWNAIIILISFYAVMSVLVRVYDGTWFRWLNVPLLLTTLLFPVRHQTKHIMEGQMPNQAVALEVLIVLIAILGTVLAVRWARWSPQK
ncbi:hypothetical protein [Pseudoduganella namucuonensis]|uniref:Uncharacterized protein n=1 Tax=Pseudoduganella namucuonensis TaxID=1035707 RepID=A0A1I7FKG5_9BURK|nr:hypothetical protein [Pseudoduganella namucuonensis]SFU36687.1 hypothetical protein SAMN05216552_1002107 [Pseudoduganella namucuonensis]